jgi:hypothetical protein
MKLIATLLCALSLTGCATAEYQAYVEAHKAQAAALYLVPQTTNFITGTSPHCLGLNLHPQQSLYKLA